MMEQDLAFFRRCHAQGHVRPAFLDIGAAKVQGDTVPNLCAVARQLGVDRIAGTDLCEGPGVDFTCDFSAPLDTFRKKWDKGVFNSVGIFNVLEHTFDPLTVLRNALECVATSGTLLVLVPAVWSLHSYPGDYNRLLPDWFEEFGKRFSLMIAPGTFTWISEFGLQDIPTGSTRKLPSYLYMPSRTYRYWLSRIVHSGFNTFGRTHIFPHSAIGVVYRRQ